MAYYAHLDGNRITSGTIVVPRVGAWTADLVLADATELAASVLVTVGDLVLRGSPVRTAGFSGNRTVRLVAGAGGWRRRLTPRAYHNPGGVMLSMVLGDAAKELGEQLVVESDVELGTYFVREAAPGQRLLELLAGGAWYVDAAGVTRIGQRPSSPISSEFTLVTYAGGHGKAVIATETLADWLPGRTFSAPTLPTARTVSMTRYSMPTDGKTRLEVLVGDGAEDREHDAWRELVRAEFPELTFLGVREYVVQAYADGKVDATPIADANILPGIVGIPLWPSILGEAVEPTVGSKILVAFIGGNPTRPIVVGGDPETPPTLAKLAGGGARAARVGDEVTITSAQILAAGMTSATGGAVTISTPLKCTITKGSSKVQIGGSST